MSASKDQLPENIVRDLTSAHGRDAVNAVMKSAYAAGWTLEQIAQPLGITRERVRQRLLKPVDPAALVHYEGPSPTKAAERRQKTATRKHRVGGMRLDSPVLQVPARDLNRLAELRELTMTVRGWTPLDDPARLAIPEFGDLLWRTVVAFGIPQGQLEVAMGVGRTTFTMWLRSHGYLQKMPSQKAYRGILLPAGNGGKGGHRLAPGGSCRKGHVLTDSDIRRNGKTGAQTCRVCAHERYLKKRSGSTQEVSA